MGVKEHKFCKVLLGNVEEADFHHILKSDFAILTACFDTRPGLKTSTLFRIIVPVAR